MNRPLGPHRRLGITNHVLQLGILCADINDFRSIDRRVKLGREEADIPSNWDARTGEGRDMTSLVADSLDEVQTI